MPALRISFIVLRDFSNSPNASRVCAYFRGPTAVFRFNDEARLRRLGRVALCCLLFQFVADQAVAQREPEPEPEGDPCLLDINLIPLSASRVIILPGRSVVLDWSVTFFNRLCRSRVSVKLLVGNTVVRNLSDVGPTTISPTTTTTYRLKAVDSRPFRPDLAEMLIGDPVTITVLQPPPRPPAIECH